MDNIKNSKIRCVVVDDDPFMRDLLRDKLSFIKEIETIDVAENASEGISKIQTYKPDIVFLDVEMPDLTGFELLSRLKPIDFKTIFVTSYDHYAIKAIRFNALDYLLKPVDLQELKSAINRYKEQVSMTDKYVKQALKNFQSKNLRDQVFTLQLQDEELRIKLGEIIYLQGDRNYTYIHLVNQQRRLVSKTLSYLEEVLDTYGFFRIHKSYLINTDHIIKEVNQGLVTMSNGEKLSVSRRKLESFKSWMKIG